MKKHLTILLMLSFSIVFIGGLQGAVTLPVTDNFPSTGPELSWADYDSPYSAVEAFSPTAPSGDGYVMNVNDVSGWQRVHLTDDDGTLGDYTITAWIYVTANEANWGRFGIFARATTIAYDAGCYYLFCDSDGDDYLRCGYYTDGTATWTQFIDPPGSITRNAWHKFELGFLGSEIVAKVDDVEVWAGSDTTYTTGYFGIICWQNSTSAPVTYCDRITITPNVPTKVSGSWSLYE